MIETLDLEAEYNNRARVPEWEAVLARWASDAAGFRSLRSGRSDLGLRYGPHPRHVIDLFRPDVTDNDRPTIVMIHGGYWRSLSASDVSHFAAGANARGYSVAVPDYRLCPEVGVADIVTDIRMACTALKREHGAGDLIMCGHSAGGHLAASAITAPIADASVPLARRGLGVSGIYDLAPLIATSINADLNLNGASARASSPLHQPLPKGAHFEAWVGELESSEFLRQSLVLADTWGHSGATTRYVEIPAADHFTAPEALADAGSDLTKALVAIAEMRLG